MNVALAECRVYHDSAKTRSNGSPWAHCTGQGRSNANGEVQGEAHPRRPTLELRPVPKHETRATKHETQF